MTDSVADDRVIVQPVPAEDQVLLDFLAAQRQTALGIVEGLDESARPRGKHGDPEIAEHSPPAAAI